jgi:hypothetical protein
LKVLPDPEPAMKPPIGKRRTREHVIADLSVCFVEWQALLCGYTVERMRHDYGIDLELKTYNENGERESGDVLIQVKASDGLRLQKGQSAFAFRIERADLVYWLREKAPIILVVFDATKKRAYWCYVQQYFYQRTDFNIFAAGKTVTLRIPIANRLNPAAMRRFARLRDRVREQMDEVYHE